MSEPFDITEARLNAGYTIRGLAREIGVAEQSLRRLEGGEGVYPRTAKKVADYFDVQVTDLMPLSREAA